MRYAELFGPPGVGKSTLLKAIRGRVLEHAQMRAARGQADTSWLDDCGGTLEWREATQASLRRAAGVWLISGQGWAVDDHGPIQRAEWLHLLGGDVNLYLERVPLPDIAVWCCAPPSVITERIKERALSGEKEDRSHDVSRACHAAGIIGNSVPCRVLDMNRPVDVVADRLMGALC